MLNEESVKVVGEFLTEKRKLDSEVYEAIRVLYLMASTTDVKKAA